MRPTRLRSLAAVAVVAAAVTWLLLQVVYGELPPLPRAAGLGLLLLAVAEAAAALSVRARLRGRPGTRPVLPIAVARLAALAKASSLVGALGTGVYAGFLLYVLPRRGDLAAAGPDALVSGSGVLASLALTVAALLLERACRTPDPPLRPGDPPPAR